MRILSTMEEERLRILESIESKWLVLRCWLVFRFFRVSDVPSGLRSVWFAGFGVQHGFRCSMCCCVWFFVYTLFLFFLIFCF